MAEASPQPMQPPRRGRQLLSIDLSADDTSYPSSYQASAIPQQAFPSTTAVPAPVKPVCSHATHPLQLASSNAMPLQHVKERALILACTASEPLHGSPCPAPSSNPQQSLPPPRDAPPLHAPRAIPGLQSSSSIPLGPIRQPLQGGPPCDPLYIARALAQPPLPQTLQLHSAHQFSDSQQRFQGLTAARAIGYCQGVRQGVVQSQSPALLTFSTRQSPSSGQRADQHQSNNTGQQARSGGSMSVHPAPGQKRSTEAAGLAQSSSKRQRLVHMAQPQQTAPPSSQGLIKFRCVIADILSAHWPGAAVQAASGQHTAEVCSTACSYGAAPQTSSGQEVELESAGAVSCGALPSSLGRGASRSLLSVPSCNAPGTSSVLPPPSVPAVSAEAMAASTTAFESLTLGSETQSRRAMPPPHRATAHTVQRAVAAAQAEGSASSPSTAALQSSVGSYSSSPRSHGRQGSVTFHESSRSQAGAAQATGFASCSFPQIMSQLLSESGMHAMQAWVAAYQPSGTSSSQQDIQAANQRPARPQKRARQGADSHQAQLAAADRSTAASAASMFGGLPAQQLPKLSSIQLLHLRAQQHMAHANASSAALSASLSSANSQAPLGGRPLTQAHLQRGSLYNRYPPAGTRPHADAAMEALVGRLSQERHLNSALPLVFPVAGPPPPAAVWPPPPGPQPPPASRLASLTLAGNVAGHTDMSSSLSQQQQQPDRVASTQGLGLQQARESCTSPKSMCLDVPLPSGSGGDPSHQRQSMHLRPAASPPDPS